MNPNNFANLSFPKFEAALRSGSLLISLYLSNDKQRCANVTPIHHRENALVWQSDDFARVLLLAEQEHPYLKEYTSDIMFIINEQHDSLLDWWIYSGGMVSLRKNVSAIWNGYEIEASLSFPKSLPFVTVYGSNIVDALSNLEATLAGLKVAAQTKDKPKAD